MVQLLQLVVVWNTSEVSKGGQVTVLAKAHTEVDIVRMKIAAFDDTRLDMSLTCIEEFCEITW